MAATLATVGLTVFTAARASAAVLGTVTVKPLTGQDNTLFGGSVNANCPSGTTDSFFSISGSDIGEPSQGSTSGTGERGFLGQGPSNGQGPASFSGASTRT